VVLQCTLILKLKVSPSEENMNGFIKEYNHVGNKYPGCCHLHDVILYYISSGCIEECKTGDLIAEIDVKGEYG
jgi:hypothetical protein